MSRTADSLSERFGRFGARLGASSLGGFLAWWRAALLSWLPPRVRQALGVDRGRLLLQLEGDGLELRLQQAGEIRDLGHLPGLVTPGEGLVGSAGDPLAELLPPRVADLPRWLLLPAASSLRRRMSLPAAAADRLRDVVGFEIDRQTPFPAEAVAFDARILGRRDSDGQLDTELVAVPRTTLAPRLAALGGLAGMLAGIDVAGADGVPLGVNLLERDARRVLRDPWRTWNAALAGIAIVATGAMLWQLLHNRREAADALEQQIAARAAPARRAAADRAELVATLEGQAFLDRLRAGRPTAVEVMDEVTRRLPDGTFLEKLAIENDRLTLIGLSNEASALVGRMQGSSLWHDAALTGALMPDPATGRDRFTLTAALGAAAPAQPSQAANVAR